MPIWIQNIETFGIKLFLELWKKQTLLPCTSKKEFKILKSECFFAEKKEIVDISYPGDIVGLWNLKLETHIEGEIMSFKGIPSFSRTF
jgi:peptide chain release factor 3